jgi:hypothetical protein
MNTQSDNYLCFWNELCRLHLKHVQPSMALARFCKNSNPLNFGLFSRTSGETPQKYPAKRQYNTRQRTRGLRSWSTDVLNINFTQISQGNVTHTSNLTMWCPKRSQTQLLLSAGNTAGNLAVTADTDRVWRSWLSFRFRHYSNLV